MFRNIFIIRNILNESMFESIISFHHYIEFLILYDFFSQISSNSLFVKCRFLIKIPGNSMRNKYAP